MTPRDSLTNHPDIASADTEHSRNCFVRASGVTNRADLCGREFRQPLMLSLVHASFLRGVGHVVLMRAKKQMSRIATRRVVAAVQHVQAIWNRAVHGFPRGAMGSNVSAARIREASVSMFVSASWPRPARQWIGEMFDALPRALRVLATSPQVTTSARTKSPGGVSVRERRTALPTYADNLWLSHVTSIRSLVRAVAVVLSPSQRLAYSLMKG